MSEVYLGNNNENAFLSLSPLLNFHFFLFARFPMAWHVKNRQKQISTKK